MWRGLGCGRLVWRRSFRLYYDAGCGRRGPSLWGVFFVGWRRVGRWDPVPRQRARTRHLARDFIGIGTRGRGRGRDGRACGWVFLCRIRVCARTRLGQFCCWVLGCPPKATTRPQNSKRNNKKRLVVVAAAAAWERQNWSKKGAKRRVYSTCRSRVVTDHATCESSHLLDFADRTRSGISRWI